MTLVEAVAATALLGSLLTGMVIAGGGFTRQSRSAKLRQQGCRMADNLLNQWWLDPDTFPRDSHGQVPDEPGWTWRTYIVMAAADSGPAHMGGEVVALEIAAPDLAQNGPACRVEIVLPVADEDE